MKNGLLGILLLASFALGGASFPQNLDQALYFLFGYFSFPVIYVTESGTANFADPLNPVTGTDVTAEFTWVQIFNTLDATQSYQEAFIFSAF